jgi:hypothetical protein
MLSFGYGYARTRGFYCHLVTPWTIYTWCRDLGFSRYKR